MGKPENAVSRQMTDYLNILQNVGLIGKHWRSQVLRGWFRPKKNVKEYWIIQGTAGLSDRSIILPDGKTLYCEAKAKKGKQRESQIIFQADCEAMDAPYVVAKSAKELSDFFREYWKGTKWENKWIYVD